MRIDPAEVVISDRINPDEVEIVAAPEAPKRQTASVLTRALAGLADPIYGAAQLADKAIDPVRQMISPGASNMADVIRQRDAEYAAPEGVDWARMAGNVANPINYVGGAAPMRAGAILSSLMPVSADENFVVEKAKQAGIGAASGGLSRALAAARQGAKPTANAQELQTWMNQGNKTVGAPPAPMLTPGQLAPEGGWLHKTENALAATPFVGAPLRSRQNEALQGYREATRAMALPPQAAHSSGQTIDGIKQAFSDAYESVLKDKTITVQSSTGPQQVSAHAAHLRETELKNEAAKLLKSFDPMQRMEGARQMAQIGILAKEWRSQLPPDAQEMIKAVDNAYSRFSPIKQASEKGANTLVTPENYMPKDVLKATRRGGNEDVRELAKKANAAVGSLQKERSTFGGNLGLGGAGLAALLSGAHIPAAVAGAGVLGYGTRVGQKVARGTQRALTADELAMTLEALRRGATPSVADQ